MTTPRTDEELAATIAENDYWWHGRINPGESMTVMMPHKGITDPSSEIAAKAQSDHVMIFFADGKPAWKRLTWKGRKLITGVKGPFEVDDYEEFGPEVLAGDRASLLLIDRTLPHPKCCLPLLGKCYKLGDHCHCCGPIEIEPSPPPDYTSITREVVHHD